MDGLLKDGLGLIDLELGLEIAHVVGDGATVGATASVGEGEALVDDFLAKTTPFIIYSSQFERLQVLCECVCVFSALSLTSYPCHRRPS